MSRRVGALVAAALSALTGCPDSPGVACPEECERGFECDTATRTCIPAPLAVYERPVPGRGARITARDDHVWTVSVDPADGGIVVTQRQPGSLPDARLLATPTRNIERHVAIDAGADLLVVAWLSASGLYQLAWRPLPGDHALWNFVTLRPTGESYIGTDDFDVVAYGEQSVALIFRDRDRTLRALTAEAPTGPWNLEMSDDGRTTDDGVTCPDTLREVQPAVGVGFDPHLIARGSQLFAAHYDGDCGDLRLARRGAERWSVTVVDTGDLSTEPSVRGMTGRWPSIAFEPGGAVALAYHDVSAGQLMYAVERDGRYETQVVDAGFTIDAFSREQKSIVGAFANLTLDATGAAVIVYLDATAVDLKVSRRETASGEWSRSTLVAEGAVGFSAAQVVSEQGRTIIAERLLPSLTGFSSELVVVEAER